MVKPAGSSRLRPPATRGLVRRHRAQRYSRTKINLRRWCRSMQPVTETAKAGSKEAADKGKSQETEPMEQKGLDEFLNTGRTGRRNACPDISDDNVALLSTSELPLDMAKLSCGEKGAAKSADPATQSASNQPS